MRIQKEKARFQWDSSTVLVLISCVCLVIQLYAIPFKRTSLMSLANQGLLWSWVLGAGYLIVKKMTKSIPFQLIHVLSLVVFVIFSCAASFIQGGATAKENITAMLNFLVLPIMFLYCALFGISDHAKKIALITNFVLSLLFIYLFNSDKAYLYPTKYDFEHQINAATLGYPNPNQTAMYLFVCTVNLFISFLYVKKKPIKCLLILDLVYVAYIMYQTESRTAVLVLCLVIALAVLMLYRPIPKVWVKLVLLIPFLYVLFAQFWAGVFEGVTFMGQDVLTGREQIYNQYFSLLTPFTFFLGNFTVFQFDNLHNGYLSIAATSGIFALVSFIFMLNHEITRSYQYSEFSKVEKAGFAGFLGVVLYSCTEAAMFVGGSTYAFLILTIYLIFTRPHKVENESGEVRIR